MSSPAAIELDYRPSYLAAAIAGGMVFLLYLVTLAPSTAMWDTSEYIAAAYVLGLPHPPGNPFFMLVGRVFAILPIPGATIAVKINLLAAISSAVSAGMWFLVTERVLVGWLTKRWQRIAGGSLAAIIGATAFTVWNQSVVNEKVYTVSLLFFAIVSWLTVRWCDDPDGPKSDRILVLIAYLIGLGYTNHPAGFLVAPAVAVAVLVRRPATITRWRLVLAALLAMGLGLTPFAYEPIRAAHFPAINEGEPTGCLEKLELDCTFSELTYERLKANIQREQYGKPSLAERQAPLTAQIGMWWLYFKWQWLRDVEGEHRQLQTFLAVIFLLLGLLGGWVHWQKDRRSFWYFGPLVFTVTLLLIYYMNFKYGYSQAPHLGESVDREVRDRDYFYLWSFSTWSVWAALGLVFVWETLAEVVGTEKTRLGRETVERPRPRSWAVASPVLALALIPLLANWSSASRAGETFTRDFAHDLLNSVEPYGILFTGGDNDTFPLWYAQEVERIRPDVTVAVTSYLNTDWYVRQLIRREIPEYDRQKGPAIYADREWQKPETPMLRMSYAEADAIPQYIEVRERQIFRQGSLIATIEPGYITRDQLIVLQTIRDSFPGRPIYFSRGAGGYPSRLGLMPYLIGQGLARKLIPQIPTGAQDTVLVQGSGFVDVPRSFALWTKVFEGPPSFIRSGYWVDRASLSIPYSYIDSGISLANALQEIGREQDAMQVATTVQRIAEATGLRELVQFATPQQTEPQPVVPLEPEGTR